MENTLHIFLYVVWFIGYVLLICGIFWQQPCSNFNSYEEYASASKLTKRSRLVGGSLIVLSMVLYWLIR